MAQPSRAPEGASNRMVQAPGGRLHVSDRPGHDPGPVLLHGFPDDSRIYDRLAPLLAPRRAVALDWLGYGRSERVEPGPFDDAPHQQQLRAVLDSLQLDRVVLVGHDAGGPDAIDFALRESGRVEHLILLNTYYGHAPALRFPELIRLLADPELTPLADAMIADPNLRAWLLGHTGRQFGLDSPTRLLSRPPPSSRSSLVTVIALTRSPRSGRGPLRCSPRWAGRMPISPPGTWRPWSCP